MTAIKFAGGVFLTYLAVMALKDKKSDYVFLIKSAEAEDTKESTLPKEFLIGFASGILNPKNPLFYLSLFTLILNNEVGIGFKGVTQTFNALNAAVIHEDHAVGQALDFQR